MPLPGIRPADPNENRRDRRTRIQGNRRIRQGGVFEGGPQPTENGPAAPQSLDSIREDALRDLFDNPGFGNLEDSRNLIRGDAKTNLRDAALRRGDSFAARGLFGSGLQQRDLRTLERESGQDQFRALNDLETRDAQLRQSGLATALSSLLGLDALELQEMLGLKQIGAQRFATRSSNELGRLGLQNSQQQFELLQNLFLGGLPGFSDPSGGVPSNFQGGNGGRVGLNLPPDFFSQLPGDQIQVPGFDRPNLSLNGGA